MDLSSFAMLAQLESLAPQATAAIRVFLIIAAAGCAYRVARAAFAGAGGGILQWLMWLGICLSGQIVAGKLGAFAVGLMP